MKNFIKVMFICLVLMLAVNPVWAAFTTELYPGQDHPQVKELQQLFNLKGYTIASVGDGSKGMETTFMGPATVAALKRFQSNNKIAPTGVAGPQTLIALNRLAATVVAVPTSNIKTSTTTIVASPSTNDSAFVLVDLYPGQNHPQVKVLQQILNRNNYTVASVGDGSKGMETTFMGPATVAALKRFQTANKIVSTGKVDSLTKIALLKTQLSNLLSVNSSGKKIANTPIFTNPTATTTKATTTTVAKKKRSGGGGGGSSSSGGGGSSGGGSATPAPVLTFSVSSSTIISGGSTTLNWSTTNATTCTASNGWTGTRATSGTLSVSPTSNATYTLTCTGAGGSDVESVSVTVNSAGGTLAAAIEVEYVDATGVRRVTPIVSGVTTISGVAPFLVKVDASDTRASTAFAAQSAITDAEAYAFLMVGYRLNYGENRGGNWTYPAGSAFSRDEDTGPPLFSYIYTTAGSHNARLKARDTLGNEQTVSFTVNVSSAPAATLIPVSAGSWPTFVSGGRYTLEADGDYRSFGNLDTGGLHNIVFEKTGSGADPRVANFTPDGRSKFDATEMSEFRAAHIRLVNIDMENFATGQRGYDYVAVIGGLIRQFSDGAQAFAWSEGTEIVKSNVRYSRGLFLQDTEVRSTAENSGFVMFGTFNGLHARNTRFVHAENGPTTYLMLRVYGSNFTLRNNLWFSEVNGGGANGLPLGLLSINGASSSAWRDDDIVGPLTGTSYDQNYGYISEKMIAQNNQFYAAGSFITNAVASLGGGNPSGSNLVYPRLIGMEDNVYFPSGDIGLLSQDGQVYGQYGFWRNNRKNMGAGAYISSVTGAPNQSVGDTTTHNGPVFTEDANTRPVPTSFSVTPAPVLTFSVSSSTIISGGSTTLNWSTTNATTCTASNGWTGTRATSGTLSVSPTSNATYTLTCTGAGGSDVESVSVTVNSESNIALSANANRISGVAPLSVFFDATGTTDPGTTRPFSELEYRWNFGDPSSGTWNFGARPGVSSRNDATGAVAAHVFETPGTYTVSVDVTGESGTESTDLTITVADPNTVFSGTNTSCISRTGDFTGCPSGAQQISTTDIAVVDTHIATGRRVLFRKGDVWSNAINMDGVDGPGILGSYGTGASPVFTTLYIGGAGVSDWRIMDLDFVRPTGDLYTTAIEVVHPSSRMTFLRVKATGAGTGADGSFIAFAMNIYDTPSSVNQQVEHAIVDSEITAGRYAFYGAGDKLAFMGNYLYTTGDNQHVYRSFYANKGVNSNNTLAGGGDAGGWGPISLVKQHAPDQPGAYSEYLHWSDNRFAPTNVYVALGFGAENSITDQRLRHIVVERNWFSAQYNAQLSVNMASGYDYTVRNNLFVMDNFWGTGVQVQHTSTGPTTTEASIYNNTFYKSDGGGNGMDAIQAMDGVTNVVIRNNLAYAPNATNPVMISLLGGTTVTESNNSTDTQVRTVSPGFLSATPTTLAHFDLLAGSYARNSGYTVPVFSDLLNRLRPQGASFDLGAVEGE